MASQNIARLGVVLGLDSGELVTELEAAQKKFKNFTNDIKRDSNDAAKITLQLEEATRTYGKTLTKVEEIQMQIDTGRFKYATDTVKKALLDRAAAYDKVAQAASKANAAESGKAGGLTTFQKAALSYQTTDIVTSLAGGQNPMMVLLQQGGQLKDQFGGLKPLFSAITEVLTPMRLAIGGVIGSLGFMALAFYKGREESDKFKNSLILTGEFIGISEQRFNGLAESIRLNFGSSISQTKDVLQQLVSSGKFTYTSLQSVAEAIAKIASLSGESASTVAQSLIPSLDGSASSAKKLNEQYHFLTLTQYKYIEQLNLQGKTQEAIKYTTDALNKSLNNQQESLGYIDQLWRNVKNSASDFWDWAKSIGKSEDPVIGLIKNEVAMMETLVRQFGDNAYKTSKYQEALANYKKYAAQLDAVEQERQQKSQKAVENQKKIDIYSDAGGASKIRSLIQKTEDVIAQTKYESAAAGLDRIAQLELTKVRDINLAVNEMNRANEDERYAFRSQRIKLFLAQEEQIIAKSERQKSDIYRDELKKYTDKARLELDAINQEKEKLTFYKENILLSETDLNIAMSRLKTEQEIAKLKSDKLLSDADKQKEEASLRYNQKQREAVINQAADLKMLQDMNHSVFSNMGNALENFVRTGKLSFKDLTRSIIFDLISIYMKAQMLSLFKGAPSLNSIGSMLGIGSNTVGGAIGVDNIDVGGGWSPRASGGSIVGGSTYLVGENGPELFTSNSSGTITPNGQFGNGMGGGSGPVFNGPYIANMSAIDTQSGIQFLTKNKQAVWAANQSAQRSLPASR